MQPSVPSSSAGQPLDPDRPDTVRLSVAEAMALGVSALERVGYDGEGARIIVGNGQVIEQGTIVVRNGRIASVGAGGGAAGAQTIDARGLKRGGSVCSSE